MSELHECAERGDVEGLLKTKPNMYSMQFDIDVQAEDLFLDIGELIGNTVLPL